MSVNSRRKPDVVWNMPQELDDSEQLQARQNMGAAALVSLAASFESRAPNYNWSANEVCTYAGKLWMFDRNHSGSWDAADVHEVNIETLIAWVRTGLVFAGNLTDGANVTIPQNNSLSTLTTAQASLTLNLVLEAGEVPNFAVEITAGADVTLSITKTVGSTTTLLKQSVAGGNALENGKFYQVTCVGSCWTLAEFEEPVVLEEEEE